MRTALLVTTVGFAGLAGSAMASDANATSGSSTAPAHSEVDSERDFKRKSKRNYSSSRCVCTDQGADDGGALAERDGGV